MSIDLGAADLLIEDEALRDGLQMEARIFSLEEKRQLFQMLKEAGLRRIQVGSFVHPQIVPQMADTDVLVRTISEEDKQLASALILNAKGLERALECEVRNVSLSVSVSHTHSMKNARMPAEKALYGMAKLIRDALAAGLNIDEFIAPWIFGDFALFKVAAFSPSICIVFGARRFHQRLQSLFGGGIDAHVKFVKFQCGRDTLNLHFGFEAFGFFGFPHDSRND